MTLPEEVQEILQVARVTLSVEREILTELKAIRGLLTPSPATSTKLVLGIPVKQ